MLVRVTVGMKNQRIWGIGEVITTDWALVSHGDIRRDKKIRISGLATRVSKGAFIPPQNEYLVDSIILPQYSKGYGHLYKDEGIICT